MTVLVSITKFHPDVDIFLSWPVALSPQSSVGLFKHVGHFIGSDGKRILKGVSGEYVFGHVETFPDLLVILSLFGIAERLVHALTNVGVTGVTGILL